MNNRIYIATFSENALSEIRNNHLNIELNHTCISESLDNERREDLIREMKRDMACTKGNAIVHGPFTEITPAAIDHVMVEAGMQRLEQAYSVCRAINVNKMVVHSGHMPLLYFDSWHIEKSIEFWTKFMEGKDDFTIYIENVFEEEPGVMKTLIESLGRSNIKACLDIGHASAVMRRDLSLLDWMKTLGNFIGHFHIHNNDGSHDLHSPINEGVIDMREFFKMAKDYCSEEVTFTIESRSCQSSVRWLKEEGLIKQGGNDERGKEAF